MRSLWFALIVGAVVLTTTSPAQSKVLVSCFHPNGRIAGRGTRNPHHYPIVASRTLPFGTIVEFFLHLGDSMGRKFIVMDRGPFVRGRSYDLDCKAAHAAGFPRLGELYDRILGRE